MLHGRITLEWCNISFIHVGILIVKAKFSKVYMLGCLFLRLKSLFNIVEAPFEKLWNFDVCVVWWCSDGPVNSQEYKSFKLCGHHQDIYDWMSPLNKQSGLPFILTQQSMGRHEQDKSCHLSIFTSLKHLMVLLRCNFSGLHFCTLSKTLVAYIGTRNSDF